MFGIRYIFFWIMTPLIYTVSSWLKNFLFNDTIHQKYVNKNWDEIQLSMWSQRPDVIDKCKQQKHWQALNLFIMRDLNLD